MCSSTKGSVRLHTEYTPSLSKNQEDVGTIIVPDPQKERVQVRKEYRSPESWFIQRELEGGRSNEP